MAQEKCDHIKSFVSSVRQIIDRTGVSVNDRARDGFLHFKCEKCQITYDEARDAKWNGKKFLGALASGK